MAVLRDGDGKRRKVRCRYRDVKGEGGRVTKRGLGRRSDAAAREDAFMRRAKGMAYTMTLASFAKVYGSTYLTTYFIANLSLDMFMKT